MGMKSRTFHRLPARAYNHVECKTRNVYGDEEPDTGYLRNPLWPSWIVQSGLVGLFNLA